MEQKIKENKILINDEIDKLQLELWDFKQTLDLEKNQIQDNKRQIGEIQDESKKFKKKLRFSLGLFFLGCILWKIN